MTIATLLRHVGIMVPRYVTVDGEIVLDGSPAVASVPLAMEPHRFHAGDDPSPSRTAFATAWWNTETDARAADEAAMRSHFPKFLLLEDDGDYAWGGELNTGRGRYKILVYPHVDRSLPSIVPLRQNLGRTEGRRWRKPPHLYESGAMCVAATSDWDPEMHTTATAVAWAAHWFAAYTEWRMGGEWPTDGYGAAA
jgi:hypothetical protein